MKLLLDEKEKAESEKDLETEKLRSEFDTLVKSIEGNFPVNLNFHISFQNPTFHLYLNVYSFVIKFEMLDVFIGVIIAILKCHESTLSMLSSFRQA